MTESTKDAKGTKDTKDTKGAKGTKAAQGGTSKVPRMQVTQLRAALDTNQALALGGLGLRRIRHTVDVVDTPSTRGLILKVRHLVKVEGA